MAQRGVIIDRETLNEQFIAFCVSNGYTKREGAIAIGINVSTLDNIRAGKPSYPKIVNKLREANFILEVSV